MRRLSISMIIRQMKVLLWEKKKRESLLTNLHFGNIKLSRKLFPTNFKLLLRLVPFVIFILLLAFHNLESLRAWLILLIRHVVFLDFISKVRFTRLISKILMKRPRARSKSKRTIARDIAMTCKWSITKTRLT